VAWPDIQNIWQLRQSFRADCAKSGVAQTSGLSIPSFFKLLSLRRNVQMPKFAIGDVVDKDKTHSGTVIAVFTTIEGEQRYAVDMEG
jgi:hypothetical protein